MKTTSPSFAPAIQKITNRLDAIGCAYRVSSEFILLEFSMDELQECGTDVYAMLDMDELSEFFGADWEGSSSIMIFEEK